MMVSVVPPKRRANPQAVGASLTCLNPSKNQERANVARTKTDSLIEKRTLNLGAAPAPTLSVWAFLPFRTALKFIFFLFFSLLFSLSRLLSFSEVTTSFQRQLPAWVQVAASAALLETAPVCTAPSRSQRI